MLQCSCTATALMPCSGPAMGSQSLERSRTSDLRNPVAVMACTAIASIQHVPIQLSFQPSELLR